MDENYDDEFLESEPSVEPLDELTLFVHDLIGKFSDCQDELCNEYADVSNRVDLIRLYMGKHSIEEKTVCDLSRQNMELIIAAKERGLDLLKN